MKKVELSENAFTVAQSRYFREDEDWEGCAKRVAETLATPETSNRNKTKDAFAEMTIFINENLSE